MKENAASKVNSATRGFNREILVGPLWMLRVQRPITALLGPRYRRSRRSIEIDITYFCNLNCYNCNRSCRQAPSTKQMTIGQIRRFIQESVQDELTWESIRILGGEPTLHPDILEILHLLGAYVTNSSPSTRIHLVTNGFGTEVMSVLSQVPEMVVIENSLKVSPEQFFHPFNVAPQDCFGFKYADYSNGCEQTAKWGIGLTPHGYYPCAIAGGIDRVFGFDIGRKKLPKPDDSMIDQLQVLCRLCGMFRYATHSNRERISSTWKTAYMQYQKTRPNLSLYSDLYTSYR